jgi:GAF domain-containing protein
VTTEGELGEVRDTVRGRPDDVAVVLTELSGLLVDGESLDERLQRVVDLAIRTIPGCDAAGITLVTDERPRTAAYTDERTIAIDRAQYEIGDGPCLDAIRRRQVNRCEVNDAEARWPAFTKAAVSESIRSFLAAPLLVHKEPLGALNLYSRQAAGFDALDEAFISLFSNQAAASVANSLRYSDIASLARQLEAALASRAVIEQAKGVLMARHGLDSEQAFGLLRHQSQHRNVKLREVAHDVVASTQSVQSEPLHPETSSHTETSNQH